LVDDVAPVLEHPEEASLLNGQNIRAVLRGSEGMRSKAEIIRQQLAGLRVLDIGGAGFGGDNAYERELRGAWGGVAHRFVIDADQRADLSVDLNRLPLPDLTAHGPWDYVTFFDVLEHLEHPVDVLRWAPAPRILVTLPNAVSPVARRMEERGGMAHLSSFTMYTAVQLLRQAGWRVTARHYIMGKWNWKIRAVNRMCSVCPSHVATGLFLAGER
jgi:hypothetical protein